ncbi:MAG: hypothetical protein JNL64_11840 [Blastocatellia bacterium]|nr:hypothetical protein [Blastocatellia bacterium]
MELALRILSVPLFGASLYFYLNEQGDRSLVAFVFAVAALFLAYRFQLKRRIAARTAEDGSTD